MDTKINLAVIGTGFGALVHIPAYFLHEKYNLVGVYGRNQEKAERIAEKYGIKKYNSKEEILEDPEVELVSIASIVSEHYDDVKMFLANKKYIVLEKPMTLTYSQAAELSVLSQQNKVKTAICHEHKYDSSWNFVKYLVQNKVLGELRCIYFNYSFTYWNGEKSTRRFDWYSQEKFGGGIKGGHFSHILDLITFIDETGIREVNGNGFIEVKHHYDENGVLQKQTAEDTVHASVMTNQGIPVYVNISATRFENFKNVTIYTDSAKILICGQNSIKIWDNNNELILSEIPDSYKINNYGKDFRLNSFMKFLDDFYGKYIENKKSDITDFSKGCMIQKFIDEIKIVSEEQ